MKSIFTKEYQIIIDILIKTRRDKKIRQKSIATRLNKTQSFVSKYESCERRLDICEFFAIARALEEDPLLILKKAGIIEK